MRVLVACEFSGIVRDAFAARGHVAVSCDLLPTERPNGAHVVGDVLGLILEFGCTFDLMIAHPPCTHLARSGARWWKDRPEAHAQALAFCRALLAAPIPRIAIENPIGALSTAYRKPDQIVQPWQFGHGETKATCLWLKGLPRLRPTRIVDGRRPGISNTSHCKARAMNRSRTYFGIAEAMAEQWGAHV